MSPKVPVFALLLGLVFLFGCNAKPSPVPPTVTPDRQGFSESEYATLASLERVDEYPLYVMRFQGDYFPVSRLPLHERVIAGNDSACQAAWGCSLFAILGGETDRLYGRNFDWRFSPALLLFTDPSDGYASVSMVDMEYLGFEGEASKKLMDLSLAQRRALLDAPALPFDGMNEKGLAVGMAAVPDGDMAADPKKETVDQLQIMREILDHAATVEEAIQIIESYNIDMGTVPVHYLIASVKGDSAVVEFYRGEMKVIRNEKNWQQLTNFLVSSVGGSADGQCSRYDRIGERLTEINGRITLPDAMKLLDDVSQSNTQWSVVYNMSTGEVNVAMGGRYGQKSHVFSLK